MISVDLHIPRPRVRAHDYPLTDAAKLARWLEKLPVTVTGEAARILYGTLGQANGYALPARDRFRLLEGLEVPLTQVLDSVDLRFHNAAFPLSARTRRIANLSSELRARMVVGYREVVHDTDHGSLLDRVGSHYRRTVSLLRILEHLGSILCNARYLGESVPEGVWRLVHRAYGLAEIDGSAEEPLPAVADAGRKTCIADEFKRILLLSFVSPHDVHRHDRPVVEALVDEMKELCVLGKAHSGKEGAHFCVQLNQDAGPSRFKSVCRAQCQARPGRRVMDTGPAVEMLQNMLYEPGEQVTTVLGTRVKRELVSLLVERWSYADEHRAPRKPVDIPLQLVHGLTGIGVVIEKERGWTDPAQLLKQKPWTPAIDGVDTEERKAQIQEADVWERAYMVVEGEDIQSFADVFGHGQEVATFDAHMINLSGSGYCFALDGIHHETFRVGDPIGLKTAEQRWTLAAVRWVHGDRSGVTLGAQRIVDDILPMTVTVQYAKGESLPMPVLIGKFEGRVPVLALHNLPILNHHEVRFGYRGRTVSVDLGDKVLSTPAFECFRLDAASGFDQPVTAAGGDDETAADDEFLRELGEVPDEGDFNDLWKSL